MTSKFIYIYIYIYIYSTTLHGNIVNYPPLVLSDFNSIIYK